MDTSINLTDIFQAHLCHFTSQIIFCNLLNNAPLIDILGMLGSPKLNQMSNSFHFSSSTLSNLYFNFYDVDSKCHLRGFNAFILSFKT